MLRINRHDYNGRIIKMMIDQIIIVAKVESTLKRKHILVYAGILKHNVKHHGLIYTINHLKQLKNYVERYRMGLKVDPLPWKKANKIGFPKLLRPFKGLIKGSLAQKRAVVSLFKLVDNIKVAPRLNVTPIERPWTGSIEPELEQFAKSFSGLRKYSVSYSNIHLSAKAGPNGKATLSSMKDLEALTSDPVLLQAICNLHNASGISAWIMEEINKLDKPVSTSYNTSKFGLIQDKAGKTRVVAIGDYWSQSALKPIHDWLITRLKRITTDATHSQGIARKQIIAKLKSGNFVGTADLTRATDRFPAILTYFILSTKMECVDDWFTIMTKRKFAPFGTIYAAGQPMGLYSRWPAFAISIHILVEYSALKLGKPNFRDYTVLGDDVAIYDESVYTEFLNICNTLAINVNSNKRTSRTKAAEFAKQLYIRKGGKVLDITGLPVSHLKTRHKRPYLFRDFLRICKDRGYDHELLCITVFSLISTLSINKRWKTHAISQILFNINVNSQSPLYDPAKQTVLQSNIADSLGMCKHGLYHGWLTEQAYIDFKLIYLLEKIEDKILDRKEHERLVQSTELDLPEGHPAVYAVGKLLSDLLDDLMLINPSEFDYDKYRLLFREVEVYLEGKTYLRNSISQSNILTEAYDRKDEDFANVLTHTKARVDESLQENLFSTTWYYLTLAKKPKAKKRLKRAH